MATSVGSINFGVTIDASGIAAELNAALTPALAQAQSKLNSKPLNVKLEIDTTAAIQAAQAKLNQANLQAKAKLKLDSNVSQQDIERLKDLASAMRSVSRLTDKSLTVKLNVDFSEADAQKLKDIGPAMRALRTATDKDITVKVKVDMDDAEVQRLKDVGPSLRAIRGLSDKDITVRVNLDLDDERLHALAITLRELRDRNVNVNVNSDSARTADNNFKGLSTSITKIGSSVGQVAKVGVALAAITGAAGAAAGAVGGLAGALAGIGPAAAAIGATAIVGLQGIGDAFSSLTDISSSAASDARSQAEAVASAQDQLTSATDAAESAQSSLADAQQTAADAAKAVGDAYKTAQERLDGYAMSLKEANLDEKEAALNLAEAKKKLAENKFTDPLDRERAVLAVQRAEVNLQKAQEAGAKLQAEANDAQQAGIDQAPEVIAAKKQQAAADKQVVQAQKDVVRANEAVAKAQQAVTDAQNSSGESAQKFADTLANLSPNAQAFVLAFRDLMPTLEESRKAIQDSLFENLGNQLTETANVAIPHLTDGMKGVASELNGMAQGFLEFTRSADGIKTLDASFQGAADLIKGAREGAEGFGKALADVATTAQPHMEGIGKAFGNIGTQIAAAFSDAAGNGNLDKIFSGFEGTLNGISSLVGSLATQLLDIGAKVLPSLGPVFVALSDVVDKIGPSLGDIGKTFADSLTKIIPVLGPLIDSLAKGLEPVLPVLADLFVALGNALIPIIDPLSQVLQVLGKALTDSIVALTPAIGPLAQAFADLITAVAPIVPVIAQVVSEIVQALAPALSEIFTAIAPVIKQVAEQLKPVFDQLAPVLAEVAKTLADALVTAIQELAPLLPDLVKAWSDLILAIAPLLPQLIDLAVQLIPPLVDVLKILIPVLTEITNAFTWLVENVITPIVEPAIEGVKEMFQTMADQMAKVTDWLTGTVFPSFGTALDSVKKFFSDAVDSIGNIWDGLKDKAAGPVNFVIGTVWNNGLLKAWSSLDSLLGGVLPDAVQLPLIQTHATGGAIGLRGGSGNGTKDDILSWLSNGEHVVTAAEVVAAGGQDVIYAIRDMIARGVPFSWDNGKIITDLGRDNLAAYGAQVRLKGVGNVPPEGLFDQLANVPVPQFAMGGAIFPWMYQLQKGHEFAKAQDGKPYQWAGPRFIGDSFDCSGFMGAIAAAILGDNPWQRYWSTASFAGYPQTGPQGFTKNLTEGSGFAIGVTDDPGGPGGGHTAGELRGIPELNIPAARVESGGSLGDVHYGRGTDPNTFASLYGLPIGANGFFQPSPGGSSNGPSTGQQSSFITSVIESAIKTATDPVREILKGAEWTPPPSSRALPIAALDGTTHYFAESAGHAVSGLGAALGGVWQRAKDLGSSALDAGKSLLGHLTPFDSGGIASGTGFMPKDIISPERVLSPEQTKLFEALVQALTKIADTGLSAAGTAAQTVVVDISGASIDALKTTLGLDKPKTEDTTVTAPIIKAVADEITASADKTGELISQTAEIAQRTASSDAEVQQKTADAQTAQLLDIANKLTDDVLGPIMSSAVSAGTQFFTDVIDGLSKDVVTAVNKTTAAVNNVSDTITTTDGTTIDTSTPAFGSPGSSFDLASEASKAIETISSAATSAFNKVRDEIVSAALAQTPSKVGNQSKGQLGKDISGGYLVDLIVKLTGVEIDIMDLLQNTYDEVVKFREGSFNGFDENGQLISDTAALVQRTATSMELAQSEQERIQKALIKAVIKYLILNVLIPIITAVLGAMITLVSTAIGAAIGSAIPIIGTAIGAAIGAAVGAALSGLAAVFTSILAVGAGAAIDSFDQGGVAPGIGFMPKNTIAPERVLSPRQTVAFETMVSALDRGAAGGNRTVQVGSINVYGRDAAERTNDNLLQLLNT